MPPAKAPEMLESIRGRVALALSSLPLLASSACVDRWTEARVVDPHLVSARVIDRVGESIDLTRDLDLRSVDAVLPPPKSYPQGEVQRVTLERTEDGAIAIRAPETVGHRADTLVDRDGEVAARPPLVFIRSYAVTNDMLELRLDYAGDHPARSYGHSAMATGSSFDVNVSTPLWNVKSAEIHSRPSRAAGAALLVGGAILGGLTLAMMAVDRGGESANSRRGEVAAGAGSLLLVGGGLGFCFAPDRITPLVP